MSSSKKFYIDRGIGRWELTAIILSFIIAMFAISYTLIAYTPIRTLIPGYPDEQMRQQQVETLTATLHNTQELFQRSASTTYLEILTAQQSLIQAQLSLIQDKFDKVQAAISLYQALGGGREQ